MYRHDGGMGAGGWMVMGVGMILFFAALVVLVIALIRYANRAPLHHEHVHTPFSTSPPLRPAEQILAERFARGEIDEDEYQRRLRALRETGS